MAKRFIDTDIFKKRFMRDLSSEYKLLWLYILNDCNHAGIWEVDFEVAGIRTGCNIDVAKALEYFKSKIIVIGNENEKWFIPSFIEFQYGELNENNRAHNSVLQILNKYKIKINKGHISPLQAPSPAPAEGLMDKDMDKDKEKEIVKRKTEEKEKQFYQEVGKFTEYPKDMLRKFYDFWTEQNPSGTKMRFELERTWDIAKRLKRWADTDFPGKNKEDKPIKIKTNLTS